jgi:CRP/FNR family cyclic AMP-dependent transcriptional regulator
LVAREKVKRKVPSVANSSADDELFTRLAALGSICRYPRNTVLQTEGAYIDTVYIVLEGRLKVCVGDERRREVRVDTLIAGDCFGLAALDGDICVVSVKTLTPIRACLLPRAQVAKLLATDRKFTKYLLLRLNDRVRALTTAVRALALQDVRSRVVGLLVELSRLDGGPRAVGPRLSQREIADRVAASPGMVSRVIKQLIADGIVTSGPGGITVRKIPTVVE